MKSTKETRRIAGLVLEQARREPDSLSQTSIEKLFFECGTARCVGGWANYFKYGNAYGVPDKSWDDQAARALGLGPAEAELLFYDTMWNNEIALQILELIADGKSFYRKFKGKFEFN